MKTLKMMSRQNDNKRLYVLISETLEPIYGAVQGGHAVAQWLIDNDKSNDSWKNNTLVYLTCNIKKYKKLLDMRKLKYSEWYEPDLDNELTAISLVNDGQLFKRLKLLK